MSLALDPRSLDDGPPLCGLGALKGAERFRCLLRGRRNDLAKLREPRADASVCQCLHGGGVEAADDRLRRSLRGPEAGPGGEVKPGRAGFIDSWDVAAGL